MFFNVQETFLSRKKDQKKNTWKKEKEKEKTGVMAQIQYESAEHSPNYYIVMIQPCPHPG